MQIVNGAPLPANVIHTPSSVFDEHGRYIGEHVAATLQPDVTVSPAAADTEVSLSVHTFQVYLLTQVKGSSLDIAPLTILDSGALQPRKWRLIVVPRHKLVAAHSLS